MTDAGRAAVVRRVLPAPPQAVYDEWTDPEAMAEWMCPRPVRATRIELDPRVGGLVQIDMDDRGLMFSATGEYLELDPPHRIRFTWTLSTWERTDPPSIVTVTFEGHPDEQTLMTIHHEQLPPHTFDDHQQGWDRIAQQLDTLLGEHRRNAQ